MEVFEFAETNFMFREAVLTRQQLTCKLDRKTRLFVQPPDYLKVQWDIQYLKRLEMCKNEKTNLTWLNAKSTELQDMALQCIMSLLHMGATTFSLIFGS